MAERTPEEIRASIEANRAELADWRGHLRNHQQEVMIGAAVAGFVLGGGIAGVTGILTRRRRKKTSLWA